MIQHILSRTTDIEVETRGNLLQARLHREPHLHGVRPAGDYLFKSVAAIAAKTHPETWGSCPRDGARRRGRRVLSLDRIALKLTDWFWGGSPQKGGSIRLGRRTLGSRRIF